MKFLEQNKTLKSFNTLGIGGPAKWFATAASPSEIESAIQFSRKESIPFFVLGKGSNILFDDRGFNGLVILNKMDFFERKDGNVKVGSGYSFSRLGIQMSKLGLKGLEFASGIPGTVGGAIYMNAGAGGNETAASLISVDFIDEHGQMHHYTKEELSFSYRYSSFQRMKGVIVQGEFSLEEEEKAKEYQMQLLHYRMKSQPYKDKSAGCAFKNPAGESAGRLIEMCGLKEKSVGDAEVSAMHANFIINKGNAKAQDVLELIQIITKTVKEKTGFQLELELKIIPYV